MRSGALGALVAVGVALAGMACDGQEQCPLGAMASGLSACDLVARDTTTLRFVGSEARACIRDHCVALGQPSIGSGTASWYLELFDGDVETVTVALQTIDESTLRVNLNLMVYPHFVRSDDVYRIEVDSAEGERIFEAEFLVELYEVRGLSWSCGGPDLAYWSSQRNCGVAEE
jgi:hypothetical protein